MHRPFVRSVVLVLATSACGPMKEGLWTTRLDGIVGSTCGEAFEDAFDVGGGSTYDLELRSDVFVLGSAEYELDGDSFVRSDSARSEIEAPCFARADRDISGTFVTSTYAEVLVDMTVSTEGDCSEVDTRGLPCSALFTSSWTYVGR